MNELIYLLITFLPFLAFYLPFSLFFGLSNTFHIIFNKRAEYMHIDLNWKEKWKQTENP